MDNLNLSKSEQALNLIKTFPVMNEMLCTDAVFYFRTPSEVSAIERKNLILQNIERLKNGLDILSKLID